MSRSKLHKKFKTSKLDQKQKAQIQCLRKTLAEVSQIPEKDQIIKSQKQPRKEGNPLTPSGEYNKNNRIRR